MRVPCGGAGLVAGLANFTRQPRATNASKVACGVSAIFLFVTAATAGAKSSVLSRDALISIVAGLGLLNGAAASVAAAGLVLAPNAVEVELPSSLSPQPSHPPAALGSQHSSARRRWLTRKGTHKIATLVFMKQATDC